MGGGGGGEVANLLPKEEGALEMLLEMHTGPIQGVQSHPWCQYKER